MTHYCRILIVDDDPLGLLNYLDLLEDHGYHAVGAPSLAQAWRELSRRDFDLLVSDHDLGDGKGTTLLRRLRDHHR
ncbi:MAG: response regulator, partial [Victivallales bacterium]|nr:response regulator [Victivallales bacterium]